MSKLIKDMTYSELMTERAFHSDILKKINEQLKKIDEAVASHYSKSRYGGYPHESKPIKIGPDGSLYKLSDGLS